jgi:hypothetical protein
MISKICALICFHLLMTMSFAAADIPLPHDALSSDPHARLGVPQGAPLSQIYQNYSRLFVHYRSLNDSTRLLAVADAFEHLANLRPDARLRYRRLGLTGDLNREDVSRHYQILRRHYELRENSQALSFIGEAFQSLKAAPDRAFLAQLRRLGIPESPTPATHQDSHN